MAVFGPIPLQAGFTSMGELADLMLKKRALQAEQPLQQAKANEANAMAKLVAMASGIPTATQQAPEPSMLQKIMGMFKGHDEQPQAPANQSMSQGMPQLMNHPYQLSPEEQQRSAQMQPGDSMVVGQPNPNAGQMTRQQLVDRANQDSDFSHRNQGGQPQQAPQPNAQQTSGNGLPMTPEAVRARQILTGLGKWNETPEEKEARETRTAATTEWTKHDIKRIEDWDKIIDANKQLEPNFEILTDKLATPEAKALFNHPEFFGWDLAYAKKFGDEKSVDIITSMNTAIKDMFTSIGSQFKGPFRKFEFNLASEALPTQNDTFAQKYAKLMTLRSMKGVVSDTYAMAGDIVRDSKGKVSPNQALSMSMEKNQVADKMKKVKREFDEKMKDAIFQKKEYDRKNKAGIAQPPPIFDSRGQFITWFKRQPKHIQKAYRKELEAGGS